MNRAAEFHQLALQQQTRRVFLGRAGRTVGSVALASLLNPGLLRAANAVATAGEPWRGVIQPLTSGQSEARDLAHDGGRAVASRNLRLQTTRPDGRQNPCPKA